MFSGVDVNKVDINIYMDLYFISIKYPVHKRFISETIFQIISIPQIGFKKMYVSKSKPIATRSACISSSSILAPIFRYAFNASEMLEQVYLVCE